jgi:hypothetical protein
MDRVHPAGRCRVPVSSGVRAKDSSEREFVRRNAAAVNRPQPHLVSGLLRYGAGTETQQLREIATV